MNLLFRVLPHNLPVFARKMILNELFEATAKAFECPVPALGHCSYEECLRAYARFSQEQADRAIAEGRDLTAIKMRLYQNAYPLGRTLRKWLGVDTVEEVMALGQILYQSIGVEMQGNCQGEITVKGCYYSPFYTRTVCDLISGLDNGVFSGLSGGRLTFTERITEGRECCRAKISFCERCS